MSFRDKLYLTLLLLATLGGFIYLIKGILLPFIVAMILAYFLDPAADKLEKLGLSRTLATVTITLSFFTLCGLIILALAPTLIHQSTRLIHTLPDYINDFRSNVLPRVEHALHQLDPETLENGKKAVNNVAGPALSFMGDLLRSLWASGMSVVNLLSLLFITPVVTFYLLRDWDMIVAKVDSWIPQRFRRTVRAELRHIDATLSGYVRGQINVCALLAVFYGLGLTLAGLEFGLFIGIATGILAVIPYIGLAVGMTIGLTVACFQFGEVGRVAIVLAVFLVGQFIEGNFITPRLIGDKVQLHPVWIIFGMLSAAAIGGFIGVLIAIPVTAVLGVLVRFALENYLKSPLYRRK